MTIQITRTVDHERDEAIERLRTFGKTHGLSLGGITIRELRRKWSICLLPPLGTRDDDLIRAARSEGVHLL